MIGRQVLWHGDRFYGTETGFTILRQVLCTERGFMVRRLLLWYTDRLYGTETGFMARRQVLWHGERFYGTETYFMIRRQVLWYGVRFYGTETHFFLVLCFSPVSIIPRMLHTHSFSYTDVTQFNTLNN